MDVVGLYVNSPPISIHPHRRKKKIVGEYSADPQQDSQGVAELNERGSESTSFIFLQNNPISTVVVVELHVTVIVGSSSLEYESRPKMWAFFFFFFFFFLKKTGERQARAPLYVTALFWHESTYVE